MSVGKKYDNGKPRWDLLPLHIVAAVVEVLTHGASEYGDHNWLLVDKGKQRYYAAFHRHLYAWYSGDRVDKKSGLPHLAHAICNLMFLMVLDGGEKHVGPFIQTETNDP